MNKIQKRYNRFSCFYDFYDFLPEKIFFAKYRQKIIPKLKGRVLEIGVGTGRNLPYYSKEAEVIGLDFSPKMLVRAGRRLKKLNQNNIVLEKGDAERLSFSANTFDFVVATFVFCSVPDPVAGFREAKRVLKTNGQAIFLEHVRSENKLISRFQDIFNPFSVNIFGFNLNRKTRENIEEAGLKIFEDRRLGGNDVLRLFICHKQASIK